jgi:hypothetical protein
MRRLGLVCAATISLTGLSLSGAPNAPDSAPKTHVLFMGADLSVEYQGQLYPVEDVSGEDFVIKVGGREVEVRSSHGPLKIKVDRALKVTDVVTAIDNLKTDRVYTPANDPQRRMIEAQSQVVASQQAVASASAVLGISQVTGNALARSVQHGAAGMPSMWGTPAGAEAKLSAAGNAANASYSQSTSLESEGQRQLSEEMYDAVDITFALSAPQPVDNPYVIALAEFHGPGDRPGQEENWVYAKAVDPIELKSRRVNIHEGGFPPGFKIDSLQIHVFGRGGVELATTISDKQVPLTRRETFAYLLLNYLGSHKGATLAAVPAMGKPAPDVRSRLDPADFSRVYFVRVSSDGEPEAAYTDRSLATPAQGGAASVLSDVRFYPALKDGHAIEGVAEVRLSKLVI